MFFDEYVRVKANITALTCFTNFKESISINEEFLGNISELIFGKPLMCLTKKGTHILYSAFFESAIKTLNSITACCCYGCFADANVLTRKYRDDLFLYLFIIEVLNNRKSLTEEEISEILMGEMNPEKFFNMVMATKKILEEGSRKDDNDKAVDAWFDNAASIGKFKKQLSIENYLKYLTCNTQIKRCISEHVLDLTWENIRQRLNNYTHNNGKKYLLHNLLDSSSEEDIKDCLLGISQDISFITSVFLVILILIKPELIMATDYVDYLDAGLQSPEDSQYWVAPFIQEYINCSILRLHPELKAFLKNNNKYGMQI